MAKLIGKCWLFTRSNKLLLAATWKMCALGVQLCRKLVQKSSQVKASISTAILSSRAKRRSRLQGPKLSNRAWRAHCVKFSIIFYRCCKSLHPSNESWIFKVFDAFSPPDAPAVPQLWFATSKGLDICNADRNIKWQWESRHWKWILLCHSWEVIFKNIRPLTIPFFAHLLFSQGQMSLFSHVSSKKGKGSKKQIRKKYGLLPN